MVWKCVVLWLNNEGDTTSLLLHYKVFSDAKYVSVLTAEARCESDGRDNGFWDTSYFIENLLCVADVYLYRRRDTVVMPVDYRGCNVLLY